MSERVHLRRLGRVCIDHPVYFITTCTHDHRPILASAEALSILCLEWEAAKERHGWLVGRYVIMPDHVHFFCAEMASNSQHSLSRFVGAWKEWTAKKLAQTLPLPAQVWQKRFFDHVLRSEESYAEKWAYVRDNPMRAGLAADPESWPFRGFIDFDSPKGG